MRSDGESVCSSEESSIDCLTAEWTLQLKEEHSELH